MTLLARVAENAASPGDDYDFKHFVRWTYGIARAYRRVEKAAFRRELRYSGRELRERASLAGFEGLVLFKNKRAAAVMMVYQGSAPDRLYLDTLAVSNPGLGLGSNLIKVLLDQAGKAGFSSVEIDTELISERGQELVSFYQRKGFQITAKDEETGNISMVRPLRPWE